MKSLKNYFEELQSVQGIDTAPLHEVDDMKKMKINTQIDLDETEGLFNTTSDRWSRRAKHQLSHAELQSASEVSDFSKGETAMYEGQEVEIRIPLGPRGTAGVMLEGHLRMVDRSKLSKLEEGVMGGLKPMTPLNRIMQLAGLEHSGSVLEAGPIEEAAGAGTMFDSLYKANLNNPSYKNNPDAAKMATIGEVLASMQSIIADLPADLPNDIATQLKTVPAIGANLVKTASAMTKPESGGA